MLPKLLLVCCLLGLTPDTSTASDGTSTSPTNHTAGITTTPKTTTTTDIPQRFEKNVKNFFKDGIKMLLPRIAHFGYEGSTLSPKCTRAFLKYIGALTAAKVWAFQMLDATGKIPVGFLEGSFSQYGSFDLCLDVVLPLRNGTEEFRGQYCAIEVTPKLPPIPKSFSVGGQRRSRPLDTMGTEYRLAMGSFYHLKFHFGLCIPSACSIEDMRGVVPKVLNPTLMEIKIPKCYTKEKTQFQTIHVVVICILLLLLILAIAGTVVNRRYSNSTSRQNKTGLLNFLGAFCLEANCKKLLSTSSSTGGLRSLHGIRSLSMAWVMLGHTYAWTSFKRSRRPQNLHTWFGMLEFDAILNGWLSVESFFLLSGLLTTYTVLQVMEKTRGRLNVPIFIFRRYLRLTPILLLTMGLIFFLPIISSGPFWYDLAGAEVESCKTSWWKNLIYISNWNSMRDICVHPTWYLSADFQLHILSLLVLLPLYRSALLGLSVLVSAIVACSAVVGALTYIWELPPAILISSGNNQLISDEIDYIHIRTFTHVGPYCVGMATGYLLLKIREKEIRISTRTAWLGWCASIVLGVSSVYGAHSWNIGLFHGPLVTSLYAALHRTTFTMAVSWVAIACISGKGGPVNWFLSSKALMPFSRLTFMVYLLHGLVMWTRISSQRTAPFISHYNQLYEFAGHLVTVLILAVPCHLLVEAPMGNLERLMFSRIRSPEDSKPKEQVNALTNGAYTNGDPRITSSVELTSVKAVGTDGSEPHIPQQNWHNGCSQDT